jgi:two-component system, NtrC family, response regulator AlgB
MRRLLADARLAAASKATILLSGESGTGKSLLARQIHLWSPRRARSFSIIDCTRLSQHEGKSTSGASSIEAAKLLEMLADAEGGTVFFASVDELHPTLQSGLAQFAQQRTIQTNAGDKAIDVRLVASTNRDLLGEVRARRFSQDLFYGLNIISLQVPALCERPADILALAAYMLAAAAIRNHRGNLQLSPEAAAAMTLYRWPGNVRELRNAMESAAVLSAGATVGLAALPEAIAQSAPGMGAPPFSKKSLEEMERQHLQRVLAESATLEQAAATLGINVTTLWRKRKRYNLDLMTVGRLKRGVP